MKLPKFTTKKVDENLALANKILEAYGADWPDTDIRKLFSSHSFADLARAYKKLDNDYKTMAEEYNKLERELHG